jgi:hypothetical protein
VRVALSATLALLLLSTATRAQQETLGNFKLTRPTGWQTLPQANGVSMMPLDLVPGLVMILVARRPAVVSGSPETIHAQAWDELAAKGKTITHGSPSASKTKSGLHVWISSGEIELPDRRFHVQLITAAPSGDAIALYAMAGTAETLKHYDEDVKPAWESLTYEPSAGGPALQIDTPPERAGLNYKLYVGAGRQLVLFDDGSCLESLPASGLVQIEKGNAPCRHTSAGSLISIDSGGRKQTYRKQPNGSLLGPGGTRVPVDSLENFRFRGRYDAPSKGFLFFETDGSFRDEEGAQAIAPKTEIEKNSKAYAEFGRGVYQIRRNTLTLHYTDGRLLRLSIYAPGRRVPQPATLVVNGVTLRLR